MRTIETRKSDRGYDSGSQEMKTVISRIKVNLLHTEILQEKHTSVGKISL